MGERRSVFNFEPRKGTLLDRFVIGQNGQHAEKRDILERHRMVFKDLMDLADSPCVAHNLEIFSSIMREFSQNPNSHDLHMRAKIAFENLVKSAKAVKLKKNELDVYYGMWR